VVDTDRPVVDIETVTPGAEGRATLRAGVSDELGETTVRWTFPDGTTATGERVTHRFDGENTTVEVLVYDEFGAATRTTHAVGTGGAFSVQRIGVPTELWVVAGALLLGVFSVLLRWRAYWLLVGLGDDHAPEVVAVEGVRAVGDRVVVDRLRVEDGERDLVGVELDVVDDGDRLGWQTVEVDPSEAYEAAPAVVHFVDDAVLAPDASPVLVVRALDDAGNRAVRRVAVDGDSPSGDGTTVEG
jgi:hypothetical protein